MGQERSLSRRGVDVAAHRRRLAADECGELLGVLLLDHRERPVAALDRARFLLSITGPYGHALYAKRPAQKLADPPRTVPLTAPALAALRIAGTDQDRVYDDLIAVNEFGQCRGVVHISDIIRGLSAR